MDIEHKIEIVLRQLENQNYHTSSGDIAKKIRRFLESDGRICFKHFHEAMAVIECNDCQIDFIPCSEMGKNDIDHYEEIKREL